MARAPRKTSASPDSGTRIAIGVLVALAVLRGALAFVPSMAAWGANVLRFVDPVVGAALWLALVAAIVVPRMRPIDSALHNLGNAVVARTTPLVTYAIAASSLAALVWLLPDRVQFTGDFRMREGALVAAGSGAGGGGAAGVFPQAMPLDAFLHFDVPRALMAATGWSANLSARVIGALEAAALALCALLFVRALKLQGGAAAAALAIVLGGASLGLFTGYGKAFTELTVATAAVAAFGMQAVRGGSPRALLGMGLGLAVAIAAHRSGVALLPAAVVVWVLAWRAHGRNAAWRAHRATLLVALALPVVAAAVFLPRALEIARLGDAVHFLPPEATGIGVGGALLAALEGARLLDLLNVVVQLSPLALAIPLLVIPFATQASREQREERRAEQPWLREAAVLVALAVPLVLVMLFVHPKQGIPRDWDVFAPAGVAISLIVAWMCGQVLSGTRSPQLARALAASAVVPALLWLGHSADAARGLARVEALVTEAPVRREAERATTWDFLAMAYSADNRWEDSARACEQAAACGRSPRRLVQWGMVESMRRNYKKAQTLYDDAVAHNPDFMLGWLGLAATSSALGDTTQCKRAAGQIQRLEPRHPTLAEIERFLSRTRTQG